MKVLEVANVDFAVFHFLLPLMKELRSRGDEVVAACADGPLLAGVRAEGFRVEVVPMARSFSPLAQARAFWRLIRLIRRERPDVIHGHMPISGFLTRLAGRICGVPVVAYTCHGYLFNQPGPVARRALSFFLEWVAGQMTDCYLTVSNEEARDAHRLRICPHAVGVGNGRDPERFHPSEHARARVRGALGTPQDQVVVVIVSRLVRHKGYPELLSAMEKVPDAQLWVVGERLSTDHGEPLDAVFQKAQAKLGARLRFLGYRSDVADVLAAADIFVLPSHFEGLPMSVIEAMLTRLPVVGTDIRGTREQVIHNVTGFLVPPGAVEPLAAALNRLVCDARLRHEMGKAGRQRALSVYEERTVLRMTADALHEAFAKRIRRQG